MSRRSGGDVVPAVCATSCIRTARKPNMIRQQAEPGRGPPASASTSELSLGIDCGTSGARSIVIDGRPLIVPHDLLALHGCNVPNSPAHSFPLILEVFSLQETAKLYTKQKRPSTSLTVKIG